MFEAVLKPGIFKHVTCRNSIYPGTIDILRYCVHDELVLWSSPFPNYNPPTYTAKLINGQAWADPDIKDNNEFQPKWNEIDGNVNRISYNGKYEVYDKYPRNPFGRTGLRGRGLLGRWGPNHAADPVVTRWKRLDNGQIEYASQEPQENETDKKGILQMVAIQRRDNGMWAIPGGMVDPGERISETLKREFSEEALSQGVADQKNLDELFANGMEIYKGYVDDHRNTDNAWMETVACNYHDETGNTVGQLNLNAGDDAKNVRWLNINRNLTLHANHLDIIAQVVHNLNAHW